MRSLRASSLCGLCVGHFTQRAQSVSQRTQRKSKALLISGNGELSMIHHLPKDLPLIPARMYRSGTGRPYYLHLLCSFCQFILFGDIALTLKGTYDGLIKIPYCIYLVKHYLYQGNSKLSVVPFRVRAMAGQNSYSPFAEGLTPDA